MTPERDVAQRRSQQGSDAPPPRWNSRPQDSPPPQDASVRWKNGKVVAEKPSRRR